MFSFQFLDWRLYLAWVLKDTTNQFKRPHQLGKFQLPGVLMTLAMLGLIIAELGGTSVLLYGAAIGLF